MFENKTTGHYIIHYIALSCPYLAENYQYRYIELIFSCVLLRP